MKSTLLAAALFGNALALEWNHEFSTELLGQENMHGLFQTWRFAHSKVYDSSEEEMNRFSNFQFNMQRIAASNDQHFAGQKSYRLRMNKFGDLSDVEFHDLYNCPMTGQIPEEWRKLNVGVASETAPFTDMTEGATVDWYAAGYAVPVKMQGGCGSCYAFSATGAMECNYAITHNEKPPKVLSEQQLVDCSGSYGNYGCSGGWYFDAWMYAMDAGGLCLTSAYPYTAKDGVCKAASCGKKYYKPTSFEGVQSASDAALQAAVDQGCVSVAIQADQFAFEYYSGGVLDGNCGTRIDHAVLVVGYGVLEGEEYWLVKNSWDYDWGKDGFVYICKNCGKNGNEGQCGINEYPFMVYE